MFRHKNLSGGRFSLLFWRSMGMHSAIYRFVTPEAPVVGDNPPLVLTPVT
jgi:hypothetical protein